MKHFKILLALFAVLSFSNNGSATVTTSPTAPTTNILATKTLGAVGTNLFSISANANHARGQLFSLPNGPGTAYQITSITVQKQTTQTYLNDTITLRIFQGTQAQWDSGTGRIASNPNFYTGTTVTSLHTEAFTLNGTINAQDFVTFELATPLTVPENTDFGFFLTYDQVNGTQTTFSHLEANNGGRISINNTSHSTAERSLNHFVQGTITAAGPILELASPFQDRMVLQRGKNIKVWGIADPNATISVDIAGINATSTADPSGNWEVELAPIPVATSGSYTLVATSGSTTKTINDVLVGDVWFCFGQSNMVYTLNQMSSWHTTYENDIIANDNIRCLKIDQNGSLTEDTSNGMNWLPNSTAGSWSAVGSVFAHQLHAQTNVPVAFIWSAWGSSSIESWLPKELENQLPHFADMLNLYQSIDEYNSGATTSAQLPSGYSTNETAIASLATNGWSTNSDDIFMRTRPNIIYNKMIHPMLNYRISGFIYYQGETNGSNITDCARYRFSLPRMVTEYRKRFNQGDLPFLGVQLPSINAALRSNWPWLRESQAELETMTNGHIAITLDTGSTDGEVHPQDKEQIGVRLSLLARKYALNESITADGPRYNNMTISGNTMTLNFDNGTGLTTTNNQPPAAFEVAGPDMNFVAATSTSISGTQVTVSANSVTNPVAVRYAWNMLTKNIVNLVNNQGLPTAPFRTDASNPPGLGAHAPQGIIDTYQINRDGTLTVPAKGVLANDIDLNNDPLTATLISNTTKGTLTLQTNGSFTYIPDAGYAGPDSFTYQSSDGSSNSQTTTVTINVLGVSSPYYIWKESIIWNTGNDESQTGDPDNDGASNFIEFALGMNPLVSDPEGLPTLTQVGNDFSYDFNNVVAGLNYEIQISNDLVTWINPAFATLTSTSTTPVIIPASNEVNQKMFIRLRITE